MTRRSTALASVPDSSPAVDEAKERSRIYDPSLNLAQRIARIALEIGQKSEDDEVSEGRVRFSYFSTKAVYGWWGELCHAWNILIVPIGIEHLTVTPRQTKGGGSAMLVTAWVNFKIINADDPSDFIIAGALGQGDDPGDKGAGKLMSYAQKNMLLGLGKNGSEGDVERDAGRQEEDYGGESRRGRDYRDDDRRARRSSRYADDGYGSYGDVDDDRDPPVGRPRDDRDDDRPRGRTRSVEVGDSSISGIQRGGRAKKTTDTQIRAIREYGRDAGLDIYGVARVIDDVLGDHLDLPETEDATGVMVKYLEELDSEDGGKLVTALRELADRRR